LRKINFNNKEIATKVGLERYDFKNDRFSLKEKLGKLIKQVIVCPE